MIKQAKPEDANILASLAIWMWPDHDPEVLEEEFRKLTKNDNAACFLKFIGAAPSPLRSTSCGTITWKVHTVHRWDIWKASS